MSNNNSFNFIDQEQLNKMTKTQLLQYIEELTKEASYRRRQKSNKKYEVLEILREGPISITDIATKMDITNDNVSSLLSYLRKQDNILIYADNEGRKFIFEG